MSGTAARQAGALIGSQTPRLIACLLALVIMVFSGSSSAHEVGSIGAFAIAKVILLQCNIAHRDNFVTWNNPHATSLLSAEHQIRGHSCALFHPRALFGLHFQQLVPHSVPLPFGIGVSNNDGYQAYDSCSNQRHDLAKLPATLAMPLAIVLMLVSLCLGFYCANFTDYSIYGIAIFSMPPFALGLALFVFCLLPCPPPIFGFELVSTSQHSAPLHRFPEDIRVAPVVVPELELRNIQGKVFAADFAVLASFCQVRDNRHRKTESAA